ncbi:hypothetical protein I350_02845 [Cryptococcus amylolentus CBS 6273]|uniref:Cleft lip and palate transmembrane protein 1 n=1 Tax=Cryptococcus amylolentus CBS 6273 TaxID=1296118 RepID=A0A1E3K8C2_9TREE|nr:hypothetical protein I350_02845 [Cryptococcus amylolentus CBS 6273]
MAEQAAQQEEQPNRINGIVRSVVMFFGVQMAMKYGMSYFGIGSTSAAPKAPINPSDPASTPLTNAPRPQATATPPALPAWDLGSPLSIVFYTSTSPAADDIDLSSPLLQWDDLTYGNWADEREADLLLDVPESVQHNGSWWLHTVFVKDGGLPTQARAPGSVFSQSKLLTRFHTKRRIRKEKKLIGGSDEDEKEEEEEPVEVPHQIGSHWANNLTVSIVSGGGEVVPSGLAPPVLPAYTFVDSPSGRKYYPPVFFNDFWLMKESLYPINETTKTLPLHLNYAPISNMKHQLFSAMTQSFDQASAQGTGGGAEFDEIKRTLLETSPWLLITTAIVTLLHTLFEFLAFSSDVSHWRKKDKDLVGVSLNTILTNCFVQLVILLYLHDSSEETSFMILFGQGIGLVIEAWKITKVTNVRIRPSTNLIGYSLNFEDKRVLTEDEKKTQEYDALAFKLVSYAAIPMLAVYTGYSCNYSTHRGWYSFIVSTLAQAIYMFGFVQLVPQLIINYKLKSVAHMPMKAMMYKTLSTVVDDFFAFCIRMPWLHRLACFRDDVVFLILLYQRWIYRVDYSRVNEYGQVNEGMVEDVGGDVKEGAKAETKKTK